MTIGEANKILLFQLYHVYDNSEAANIADLVMEYITGWTKIDRVVNKQVRMSGLMQQQLDDFTAKLIRHMPVQYVLNETWFFGMKFFVNSSVLIPRPETEELVDWLIRELGTNSTARILDIGTGSGCIAITLKNKLPRATLFACDLSVDALNVAKKNAENLKTDIVWLQTDVLDGKESAQLPVVDVIVSNPPYIPVSEKARMLANVTEYEPHLALFVKDEDPLSFYRAIAGMRVSQVFAEVHELLAEQIVVLFRKEGYEQVDIKKDMQGKDRMIRAVRALPV